MTTVAELLDSYVHQARLEPEDVLELLLEFCADSGMEDAAVATLSERIEEEGIVDELQEYLVQRGLLGSAAMSAGGEQQLDVADEHDMDLDEEDLE